MTVYSIVFPEQEENGGYMRAQLASYCIGENVDYVKITDSCKDKAVDSIPDM